MILRTQIFAHDIKNLRWLSSVVQGALFSHTFVLDTEMCFHVGYSNQWVVHSVTKYSEATDTETGCRVGNGNEFPCRTE